MIVRFLKNPPAAHADHLTCRRDDETWETELPRAGVLPVLAVRYVIESSLGWNSGWFGTTASKGKADDTTEQARQSNILAGLLQSEQWGGASPPDAFRQKLATACSPAELTPPELTDEQLATLRNELRAFGSIWRPLGTGQLHEVVW